MWIQAYMSPKMKLCHVVVNFFTVEKGQKIEKNYRWISVSVEKAVSFRLFIFPIFKWLQKCLCTVEQTLFDSNESKYFN